MSTISGTSVSNGSPYTLTLETVETNGGVRPVYDASAGKTAVVYSTSTGTVGFYSTVWTTGYTATNNTSFIGITDQAIANTATGAVIVQGGVSEKVSGLTTGSDYYVQGDGTLSTSTSSVPAGRALSATSILLEG